MKDCGGFIQIDRETLRVVRSLGTSYLDLYIAIHMTVNYEVGYFDGHRINRGEMAFSWRKLPARLYPDSQNPPSINTLRLRIAKLESAGVLRTEPIDDLNTAQSIGTRLTVSKFDTTSNTTPDTTSNTTPDTDLIRKRKKRKENKQSLFVPPKLDEIEAYAKEIGSSVCPKKFFRWYDEAKWRKATGKPVDNWKLTFQSWSNREDEQVEAPKEGLSCAGPAL